MESERNKELENLMTKTAEKCGGCGQAGGDKMDSDGDYDNSQKKEKEKYEDND